MSDDNKDADQEIIDEAKSAFEEAQEAASDNMNRYEADIRFGRLGEQWEYSDIETRKAEGRPL